ncbi:unnamed protein product [Gordionus sp. m RMFG-2023]
MIINLKPLPRYTQGNLKSKMVRPALITVVIIFVATRDLSQANYPQNSYELGSGFNFNNYPPAIQNANRNKHLTLPVNYEEKLKRSKINFSRKIKDYCLKKADNNNNYHLLTGKYSQRSYIPDPFDSRRFYICSYDFQAFYWRPRAYKCPENTLFCDKIQKCLLKSKFEIKACQFFPDSPNPKIPAKNPAEAKPAKIYLPAPSYDGRTDYNPINMAILPNTTSPNPIIKPYPHKKNASGKSYKIKALLLKAKQNHRNKTGPLFPRQDKPLYPRQDTSLYPRHKRDSELDYYNDESTTTSPDSISDNLDFF